MEVILIQSTLCFSTLSLQAGRRVESLDLDSFIYKHVVTKVALIERVESLDLDRFIYKHTVTKAALIERPRKEMNWEEGGETPKAGPYPFLTSAPLARCSF